MTTTDHMTVFEAALDALDLGKHEGCPCSECRPAVNRRLETRGTLKLAIAAMSGSRPSVVYLCHPVGGDVEGNTARALRWLRYLRRAQPDVTTVAPWIGALLSGEDDSDPVARERGLRDCEAVAARADAVVLCGGRVSAGMARERDACVAAGGYVIDLTHFGEEPPLLTPIAGGNAALSGGLSWVAPDRSDES